MITKVKKTEHLQIRVTPKQKEIIEREAVKQGYRSVAEYVLNKIGLDRILD